jgi:hypothetical protein
MMDLSLCPNPWVKKGYGRAYNMVVTWLQTVGSFTAQDASGGKIKAALTSKTPLYVTAYQYTVSDTTITCMNVMVERQDYRLIIGFDDRVVRIETLDARSARAETKNQLDRWTVSANKAAGGNAAGGDEAANYNYVESAPATAPTANDYRMTGNVPDNLYDGPGQMSAYVGAGPMSLYNQVIPAP